MGSRKDQGGITNRGEHQEPSGEADNGETQFLVNALLEPAVVRKRRWRRAWRRGIGIYVVSIRVLIYKKRKRGRGGERRSGSGR